MSVFRKERDCPSSFDLADAVCGRLDGDLGLRIASHLAVCDFCSAEVELYREFPPDGPQQFSAAGAGAAPADLGYAASVENTVPPIPAALFELAESLFAREPIHISRLERLFREAA